MIYLNDDFESGETIFYEDEDNMEILKPVSCTGVIFNHDLEHEGEVITKGTKYILRTDIMFYRINYLEQDDDYTKSEEWIKSEGLYKKSVILQNEGKPKESTEAYLEAQTIMTKHKTYKSPINRNFAKCIIGNTQRLSILTNILNYLIIIPHELEDYNYSNDPYEEDHCKCEIKVSSELFKSHLETLLNYRLITRSWDQYITSNTIWRRLIENKWGMESINIEKFPNDRRLFEIYKLRTFLKIRTNPLLIIDFGFNHVRYMFNNKVRTYLKEENTFLNDYRHNTAGICNSTYYEHFGHRWGWDSGFEYWIGDSPIQRYTSNNSIDYSENSNVQKIWLGEVFNLKAATSLINELDYMVYYTQDIHALISLPYYIIAPSNNQSLLKADFIGINVKALIPREIIVFNNYEIDTGILIYFDGECGSLTLLDMGMLVERLCIRIYESEQNLKAIIKEQVKKIKDKKFYVNELIMLSEDKENALAILEMLKEFNFKVTQDNFYKLFECFNQTLSQRLFYEDIMSYFEI
jgi:hypothetical protein